jgi:hypothetical protein
MSPQAEMLLLNEIQPRIQAAVGKGRVRMVGSEDTRELVQDGLCIAAKMLDAAETQGKAVTAGNIAFFAIQSLKSGRRFGYAGKSDVLSPGAMLAGHASVVSLDEPRGEPDDDPDGEFTLHDVLAATGEDAGTAAGRRIDWDQALQTMDARTRGILQGTAEGVGPGELAARYSISAPRVCQVRDAAGAKITQAWGGNPVVDATRETAWIKHVRTYAQQRTCRACRAEQAE